MKAILLLYLIGILHCAVYPYDGNDRYDDFFNGEYASDTVQYYGGTFFNQCGEGCLRCDYLTGLFENQLNSVDSEYTL